MNIDLKKEVNIPNLLTLFRLVLIPFILYNYYMFKDNIALPLFVIALLTDLADGHIARKYNQTTEFGRLIDPLSDKLLFGSVLFMILFRNDYYLWILFFVGAVLFYIVGYMYFLKKQMRVSKLGKLFIVAEAVILCLMMYGYIGNIMIILFAISLSFPVMGYITEMIRE